MAMTLKVCKRLSHGFGSWDLAILIWPTKNVAVIGASSTMAMIRSVFVVVGRPQLSSRLKLPVQGLNITDVGLADKAGLTINVFIFSILPYILYSNIAQ